jgi:uncharacterized LabA/DUF88 family protein
MASSPENISMAVFCDFENVALGVRDANYEKFDIKPVLERLLLKGSIVVKKSYCDWDRYKGFKATMHEANFELIEIPHVRQSGKNSADIRMVVDALDLCYTKAHVNTFVIVSGDSDFSPLVSKLRENAKRVIGVGVKQSTSDLLVANCDEFIFYDDLVREQRRAAAKRDERKAQPQSQAQQGRRPSDENNRKREEMEARKLQALEMVVETFDDLVSERGDTGKIWASLLKDTLKRRRPDFSETYYGFRTFGNLLEEAQTRGLFEFGRDEKSGTYVYRNANLQADLQSGDVAGGIAEPEALQAAPEQGMAEAGDEFAAEPLAQAAQSAESPAREPRRRGGRGRKGREQAAPEPSTAGVNAAAGEPGELGVEMADEAGQAQALDAAEAVDAAPATPGDARAPRGSSRPARPARPPRGKRADYRAEVAPAPTPDLVEAEAEVASQAADADEALPSAAAAVEPTEATGKERRRSPRAPRKTAASKTAKVDAEVDNSVAQAAPAAATAAIVADSAPAGQGNVGPASTHEADEADWADEDDVDGNVAPAPDKSTRPAHKASSRKSAPRARRPAKAKATDKG